MYIAAAEAAWPRLAGDTAMAARNGAYQATLPGRAMASVLTTACRNASARRARRRNQSAFLLLKSAPHALVSTRKKTCSV